MIFFVSTADMSLNRAMCSTIMLIRVPKTFMNVEWIKLLNHQWKFTNFCKHSTANFMQ
jgi:hypothetical protein